MRRRASLLDSSTLLSAQPEALSPQLSPLTGSTLLDSSSIFLEAGVYSGGSASVGDPAESVAVADVNGDGKPDLIIPSTNRTVGVLLGNGDGTFQPAVSFSSGGKSVWVSAADLNGDGKIDLVIANLTSGVSVLLGNGDGTFQAPVSYGGPESFHVAITDLNGDGKPDLIVDTTDGVGVLLGNGDGTFQAAVSYASGYRLVAVADVNGDGKADVELTNGSAIATMLGNGDGTFQPPISSATGQFAFGAVADVNKDGKLDLVVPGSNGVTVLLGNGDGTFTAGASYLGSEPSLLEWGQYGGPSPVALTDLNGDGKPDLLVGDGSGAGNGEVNVLFGNGDGTFQAPVVYSVGGVDTNSVVAADLNGDGISDLVASSECLGNVNDQTDCIGAVSVMLAAGGGSFRAARTYDTGGDITNSIAVADVNGDGYADLVISSDCASSSDCTQGTIEVLPGNGDGTFQAPVNIPGANGWGGPGSIAVADVNGDGRPDLVFAAECADSSCSTGGAVNVLLGNGDFTFQAPKTYANPGGSAYVAVADMNGDGKPDIVILNSSSGTSSVDGSVSVYLGNGDGTFQPANSFDSGGIEPWSLTIADVNADGIPDLLIANSYFFGFGNGTVSVLLGNGDATFKPAVSYSTGGKYPVSVATGDMNRDGKPDVIVLNECAINGPCNKESGELPPPGTVGILLGNGDGTFQAASSVTTPGSFNFTQLVAADFDGDGKLDVASGGGFLLQGNGDGTFQPYRLLGLGGEGSSLFPPSTIAVGDFNGDGGLDLAVGQVTVLLNRITMPQPTMTALSSSPNPISFGQKVVLSATVTPQSRFSPTGTVTFYNGTAVLGAVALNDDDTASLPVSPAAGNYTLTAAYSGDKRNLPSTSAPMNQVVAMATTATILVSSASPVAPNQSVTYTATVSSQYGGVVTGTVAFRDGNQTTNVSVIGGKAVLTASYNTKGAHSLTAEYSGDGNNAGSTSNPFTEYVENLPVESQTAVVTANSSSFINQPVTFTATISSDFGQIPDGETVSFLDGATQIGTGITAGGAARFTTSSLTAKTHTIKARYAGDSRFKSSLGTVQQIVNLYPTITALSANPDPSKLGQPVTLTAQVTGSGSVVPTGTVTFKDDDLVLGTAPLSAGGVASLNKARLLLGRNRLTATYNGDSVNDDSASAVLIQTVKLGPIAITLASPPIRLAAGRAVNPPQ